MLGSAQALDRSIGRQARLAAIVYIIFYGKAFGHQARRSDHEGDAKCRRNLSAAFRMMRFWLFASLTQVLQRFGDLRGAFDLAPLGGSRPQAGVLDDAAYIGVMISAVGLVARLEVENLTIASAPAASGTEYFANVEPGFKHLLVGLRNIEEFRIAFLHAQLKVRGNTLGDGVGGCLLYTSRCV